MENEFLGPIDFCSGQPCRNFLDLIIGEAEEDNPSLIGGRGIVVADLALADYLPAFPGGSPAPAGQGCDLVAPSGQSAAKRRAQPACSYDCDLSHFFC
jgi:hypothetical protein